MVAKHFICPPGGKITHYNVYLNSQSWKQHTYTLFFVYILYHFPKWLKEELWNKKNWFQHHDQHLEPACDWPEHWGCPVITNDSSVIPTSLLPPPSPVLRWCDCRPRSMFLHTHFLTSAQHPTPSTFLSAHSPLNVGQRTICQRTPHIDGGH